jgi:hypothetical protein
MKKKDVSKTEKIRFLVTEMRVMRLLKSYEIRQNWFKKKPFVVYILAGLQFTCKRNIEKNCLKKKKIQKNLKNLFEFLLNLMYVCGIRPYLVQQKTQFR